MKAYKDGTLALTRDEDSFVRTAAVQALATMDTDDVKACLMDLFCRNPDLRVTVFAALAKQDVPLSAEAVEILRSTDAAACLAILAEIGNKLRNESPELGSNGKAHRATFLPLLTLVTHADAAVKRTAAGICALVARFSPEIMAVVLDQLRSDDAECRLHVLRRMRLVPWELQSFATPPHTPATSAGEQQLDDMMAAFGLSPTTPLTPAPGDTPTDDLMAAFFGDTPPQSLGGEPNAGPMPDPSVDDLLEGFLGGQDDRQPGTAKTAPTTATLHELHADVVRRFERDATAETAERTAASSLVPDKTPPVHCRLRLPDCLPSHP